MVDLTRGKSTPDVSSDTDETQHLLSDILIQLKIMNLHFEEWDSTRITEKDIFDKDEI